MYRVCIQCTHIFLKMHISHDATEATYKNCALTTQQFLEKPASMATSRPLLWHIACWRNKEGGERMKDI